MNKNNQQETHIDTSWFATAKYIFLVFIYATAVCMFRWGWGCNNNLYHQVIVFSTSISDKSKKPEKSKSSLWKWQLYSGPYIIGINEEREHSMYKLVVLCPTLTSSSLFITAEASIPVWYAVEYFLHLLVHQKTLCIKCLSFL